MQGSGSTQFHPAQNMSHTQLHDERSEMHDNKLDTVLKSGMKRVGLAVHPSDESTNDSISPAID